MMKIKHIRNCSKDINITDTLRPYIEKECRAVIKEELNRIESEEKLKARETKFICEHFNIDRPKEPQIANVRTFKDSIIKKGGI